MNRRQFIALQAAATAAAGGVLPASAAAKNDDIAPPVLDRKKVKPRNRCPYRGIDWKKAHQINGTTHLHQYHDLFETVKEHKLGFLTMSNYYPSAPICPLKDLVYPRGVPVSDWPLMVNGVRTPGPFDWNKIVSQWIDKIPKENLKAWPRYPYKVYGKNYKLKDIPPDLLEAPNAEHHSFKLKNGRGAARLHMCAPGSAFASGTFDAHNRRLTGTHGYCSGSGEFWGTAIDRMIQKLIIPDGGGVTINHPSWTRLDRGLLLELLDWDPRVLGIEVLESGWNSEHYWDWVLSTGRQCFGFFVPDHARHIKDFGVCVLVVPERTVEACLRAYRNGDFYGAAHGIGELRFESIVFDGATVKVETDKPAKLELITARGVRKTVEGTSLEWKCPEDDRKLAGAPLEIYARVRATSLDGCNERLFTQPYMLT